MKRIMANISDEAHNRLDSMATADNCHPDAIVEHLLMGRMIVENGSGTVPELSLDATKRCQHITSEVRAVSTHQGMKVGARVSPSGALWWCVGCGGLFADTQGTHPVATPTWGTSDE